MTDKKPDAPGSMTRAIAAELRAEMAVKKISRPRLAELTGIGNRSLQRYLNAHRRFDLDQLDLMAKALGTTAPDITYAAELRRQRGDYDVPPVPETNDDPSASETTDSA